MGGLEPPIHGLAYTGLMGVEMDGRVNPRIKSEGMARPW